MKQVSILSRFQGAFAGAAIGDGMGMPVETMKHYEIMALNNGSGMTGYMNPIQTTFPEVRTLTAAATTDDWQLTAAVARSLIRCGGKFDLADCAAEHVSEWKRDNRFWGRSSRAAIAEIAEGKRDPSVPPVVIPGKTGLGNGVIMKIAPLALADFGSSSFTKMNDCRAFGCLTHGDARAAIAAYAVMRTMCVVLGRGIGRGGDFDTAWFLSNLISDVQKMEVRFADHSLNAEDQITGRLGRIASCLGDMDRLRRDIGCGFISLETAPFTIATFLRHPTDFRAGVLEAVNAGGDTDTHASIVGSLIGANVGIEGIPPEWLEQCPARREAQELADALYACVG